MAARTTGNTKSKGISGGEIEVKKSGPNNIMAAIIKNAAMEPCPHTSGCVIFLQIKEQKTLKGECMVVGEDVSDATGGNGNNVWCWPSSDTTGTQSQRSLMDHRSMVHFHK
ncbi:hypothetical protein CR513_12710, partial [Mucuna pruriens]